MLSRPEVKREYDLLQPETMAIQAVLRARQNKKLSQKMLAEKIGTQQSVISRFESGGSNPSLAFLKKLATALDSNLEIYFVEK